MPYMASPFNVSIKNFAKKKARIKPSLYRDFLQGFSFHCISPKSCVDHGFSVHCSLFLTGVVLIERRRRNFTWHWTLSRFTLESLSAKREPARKEGARAEEMSKNQKNLNFNWNFPANLYTLYFFRQSLIQYMFFWMEVLNADDDVSHNFFPSAVRYLPSAGAQLDSYLTLSEKKVRQCENRVTEACSCAASWKEEKKSLKVKLFVEKNNIIFNQKNSHFSVSLRAMFKAVKCLLIFPFAIIQAWDRRHFFATHRQTFRSARECQIFERSKIKSKRIAWYNEKLLAMSFIIVEVP